MSLKVFKAIYAFKQILAKTNFLRARAFPRHRARHRILARAAAALCLGVPRAPGQVLIFLYMITQQYLKTSYDLYSMQTRTSSFQPAARVKPTPLAPATAAALSPQAMQASAGEAAAMLKALAHPDRLMLLCQLAGGERSVADLGALAGVGQPSLSQQLGVLRGERLVATRREGKQVIYRLASPAALALLQTLHALFCEPEPAAPVGPGRRVPGRRVQSLSKAPA